MNNGCFPLPVLNRGAARRERRGESDFSECAAVPSRNDSADSPAPVKHVSHSGIVVLGVVVGIINVSADQSSRRNIRKAY